MNSRIRHTLQEITGQYAHEGSSVPYRIWHKDGDGTIPLVVFLGTIQIGALAEWVAELCPPNSFVIEGAPHWLGGDTEAEVAAFMFRYTQETFRAICDLYAVEHVNVIAESQAVPGVLKLFAEHEFGMLLNALSLVQPLGLNQAAFGGNSQERMDEFHRRLRKNLLHQIPALVTDGKLRHNHRLLYGTIKKDQQKHHKQYSSGLSYDALPSLCTICRIHQNIVIVCGEKDEIFPGEEVRDALSQHGLYLEVRKVHGVPHSPLATKWGQKLLSEAIESLRG